MRDVPRLAASRIFAVELTTLPGVISNLEQAQPVRGDKLPDPFFLLLDREKRNYACKILYGEQLLTALDYRDPDGIDGGIEDIRAVPGRMHPAVVESGGICCHADILCNVTETHSGFSCPSGQVGFAWQSVQNQILLCH